MTTASSKRVLKSVAPLQCGKVLALLYGALGLIFVPFLLLMALFTPEIPEAQRGGLMIFGTGFALAAPIMYAAIGFITGALGAVIYNLAAKWVGGIEVEVEERSP